MMYRSAEMGRNCLEHGSSHFFAVGIIIFCLEFFRKYGIVCLGEKKACCFG